MEFFSKQDFKGCTSLIEANDNFNDKGTNAQDKIDKELDDAQDNVLRSPTNVNDEENLP